MGVYRLGGRIGISLQGALMSTRLQFTKFLIVGGSCTALQYLCLWLLVHFAQVDPTLASSIGFVLSAVLNFHLNHYFTFGSGAPYARAAASFALVSGIGLLLNAALMKVLTDGLLLHYLLAQVVTTAIVLCWNFGANKWWTYGRPRRQSASSLGDGAGFGGG